jgi:CDP-glucose 4,6-dehydratase
VAHYGKGEVVDASDPNAPHEATMLNLDVTKAYVMLQWESKWSMQEALEKTVDWYKEALTTSDMYDFCIQQILDHGEHIAQ